MARAMADIATSHENDAVHDAAPPIPQGGLEVVSIAKSYDTRAVLTDISLSQYTFTGLTSGNTYRFKYSVVSESGESPESAVVSITAATTPSQPGITFISSTGGL